MSRDQCRDSNWAGKIQLTFGSYIGGRGSGQLDLIQEGTFWINVLEITLRVEGRAAISGSPPIQGERFVSYLEYDQRAIPQIAP